MNVIIRFPHINFYCANWEHQRTNFIAISPRLENIKFGKEEIGEEGGKKKEI